VIPLCGLESPVKWPLNQWLLTSQNPLAFPPLGRAKFQFLDLDAKLDWFLRKYREIIGQFAALLALGNL
jgi:hypothetical protein